MNERAISVRNGRFEVDLLEGGSGDPLLFLHGVSGLEWTPLLERLSVGHTVIAPRTPGFGESDAPARAPEIVDLANCLRAMGAQIEGAGGSSLSAAPS